MIANHQIGCLSASVSLNDASIYLVERLTFTRFTRCLTLSVVEDAWRQLPAEKSESFAARGNYNPVQDNAVVRKNGYEKVSDKDRTFTKSSAHITR